MGKPQSDTLAANQKLPIETGSFFYVYFAAIKTKIQSRVIFEML